MSDLNTDSNTKLEKLAENKCFGGRQLQYSHASTTLTCNMRFSIYLPPQAGTKESSAKESSAKKVPVLYWLSGLTCTDENFVQKAGAQQYAAKYGIAIVMPDTSPRGDDIPDDPDGAYDFGLGAGFYLNATQAPWDKHYRMYDYITEELPTLINANFPILADRQSISGHSMGGHGAITIALKNPERYRSVSAFAPICSPIHCPWGQKALSLYLGNESSAWENYDSSALISKVEHQVPLLVDQGGSDNFLEEQLQPERLQAVCQEKGYPLTFRLQAGYDHSYFFIASFIEDHIAFHSRYLLP